MLLPSPNSFPQSDKPLLEIIKGPGKGKDLALVTGPTAQIIGRNASKELWTRDELKNHMLSPKKKQKQGAQTRTDFSPVRKEQLKGSIFTIEFFKVRTELILIFFNFSLF